MRRSATQLTNTPVVVAPFSRIVVLITGREHVAALLDCVAGWAQAGARVRVAALAGGPSDEETGTRAAQGAFRRLILSATVDAACETLVRCGIEADPEIVELHESERQTAALARAMCAWQADLAIGAPSNPVALAGSTERPVLVLPQPFVRRCPVPPQRIFVASDGSAASAVAVREAARVAVAGAALRVGYLACDPASARHPEDFDAVVLEAQHDGDAASHAIVEAALQWRADLLVLGTRGGHEGGRWRFGSVAADVAQRIVLPLLLVPQPSGHASLAAGSRIH
ncbi:universal stress protein [Paraburkholderia tagetis]|uniref:Universal stress protein n=1 Tax=Paraburkholderia tagetis TaxID=2913261 RepID=A0A9X1RW14_9BURK|nr:universal stress protein [Paraburkholderia tagetis]MCG5076967.1 universal stress protein [Paraburkholderia tagetis]